MKNDSLIVKVTASTLLFTFSYSQILMAADVRQMLLDAKNFFAEEDAQRPHGMAASDLQAAQTQQQAAVDQQQLLQDFQNTTFNLTTPNGDVLKYVGDKLSEVSRPDGTQLAKIVTDAAGNIQNADLKLSDGSFQVFEGGKVTGYQTPDGSQVLYDAAGAVWKVISKAGVESLYTYTKDATGKVIETVVDNAAYQTKYDANQKIKEATRKSDNQKIYYTNGVIQKIVNGDASQTLFTSAVVGGDTVVTPQGGASDVYVDAQGNKFYFASGSVSKITLTDGSNVDSITWDASNKIDNATLTESDGSKYVYQLKKLTRSYDVAGVVTNYTYTATSILAVKAGETWEYLLDKTPLKYTSLLGTVTTFIQSGVYKGLREREVLSTGQTFIYEYAGSGASTTVQKRELQSTTYNIITFDSSSVNAQASNPGFKTTVQFANDGTIDQSAVITAKYSSTKNLALNMVSGTGSTYTWNGVTTSLGATLNKGIDYKVEVRWETGRIGIYVYAASSSKPATPTASITDRAWDPTFKAVATNTQMVFDSTSSGYYNRNIDVREKNYGRLPSSPVLITEFNRLSTSYRTLYFKATQSASGSISRTLTYWLDPSGVWSYTQSDYSSTTGATTNTNGTLSQTLTPGIDYVGELRIENGKSNLYIYQKGTARPVTPTISLNAFNVSTTLECSFTNATGQGALYKNLTTPVYSSALSATPLTSRLDTVKNSTIVKPAAPSSVNATDFTSITYDSTSALKQVLFKDGSKLNFSQGVLTQAFDAAGKQTTFNFEQSGLSNIVGSSIAQSNLTSTYSADGKLSSVKTGELTIHYKTDGSSVDWIEKTDGTELWDLVFDASGALTGASIYAPNGEIRTYASGKLINLRQADQSQLFYANNKVTQMITPEKLTYNFDYTNPAIIQATLAGTPPVDTLTPIKMEYDTSFNLKKVTRQNQEILNYLNTDLVQIDIPSGAPKVFNYQKDAAGKVLSYTVTQGNIITYYDANNQPTRAVISPDASNPNTLDISYQYGKIRQIKKNNVVTFTYSYSFEADGTELSIVEDVEENTQKTYKNSNLASSLDKATNVLSSYEYTSTKVSKVTVTRFGRLLHTYGYSYSGTNTLVQDEAGVVRTYDANKKLGFLEKNGEKFGYTYSTQTVTTQNGPPVTMETLLPNSLYLTSARSVLSWDGSAAWFAYEQAYGKDYLQTHWAGQWVEYTVNMSQAGDLKIALEATDSNILPAGYTAFQLDLSVDGALKGSLGVPAVGNNAWQSGTATLTGLSQGSHVIRLKFANFLSSGGQQTDFKFRNISFKQVVTTQTSTTKQVDIVSEQMTEKRMPDGALIHYSAGRVSQIDQADGKVLKNFTEDASGNITEVTVFANAQSGAGTKVAFSAGRVSKVTLLTGQTLTYSYDKDANGNVVTTWAQKGAAILKYDAQEAMMGVKIAGVMDPAALMAGLSHVYIGGSGGFLGFDGNVTTAQTGAFGGGTGNVSSDLAAEHDLPAANTITGFSYKLNAFSSSNGSTNNGSSAYILLETKDATTGLWTTVPGTYAAQSHSNGGGGGSTASAQTAGTGLATVSLNIPNVIAVRARVGASAYSNGGGSYSGNAYLYEVQFSLADESLLTLGTTTNASGQATSYSLSGVKGTLAFNASGAVTQPSAALSSIQSELTGVIQNYKTNPYKNSDFSGMWAALYDSETLVAQEYSASGTLETQTKVDGTTTLFENNKPSKVLDRSGRILIQYAYDAQGNPTRVYLKNARDTLPDEVIKAQLDIQTQRAASLRSLAAQKNLAYQSIQAQFQNARIVLDAQAASQQGLYDSVSSADAKGKDAKGAKADALGQIGDNIDLIRTQLTSIYDQEADAYAALDAQVMTLSNQIEADTVQAVTNLATQEANMKREILKQEVSPIVYDYYRRILGRDPDTMEYNYWIGLIDYNSGATLTEVKTTAGTNLTAALSTYINALPELAQRQTYVNAIKAAVTSQINGYLAMTDAQKQAFAATLGLTAQDLIPLSSTDASSILAWINSRSLHFGQSAFLALESLLDQKGKVYTREVLAKQAILVDILTGVISPLDDGDLVLSIFALNKVAGLYGVTLTGANVSWDDLKAIIPATATASSPRVIAHINGNHYVIVTAMTDTSITYIDPGIGKDKLNESLTVSKAGFLKVWQGNITLNQADFDSIKTVRGAATQAKVLSAMEAKSVRGAFWGSILGLIGSILTWIPGLNAIGIALTAISAAVSAIEGDWVTAISSVVTLGLGSFGSALKGAFDSVVKAMGPLGQVFQAAGNIVGGIYKAVTGLVGNVSNALGGFLQGVGIGSGIATRIAQTAVSYGISVGVSKGFEAIGVSPQIASFLGSLTAGGVMGGTQKITDAQIQKGITQSGMIKTSLLQIVTIANVGNLGQSLGLDSTFTQILGMSLAAIQGIQIQNPTTSLQKEFALVKPIIKDSLSWYGFSKAGEILGLSQSVAMAAAMPIAQSLSTALNTGNISGQQSIQSIQSSLVQGAVAYGIQFTGNSSPVLGSLLSRDIALGVEQALGANGLFGGVLGALDKAALNIFNVVGGAVKTIFDASTDLATLVQQKGIGILETLNFFSRSSQESLLAKGGIQIIVNTTPKVTTTLQNGQSVQELKINQTNSLYYDAAGKLVGKKEDGLTQYGTFGVTSTKVGITKGDVYGDIYIDGTIVSIDSDISGGQATNISASKQGQNIVTISPAENLPQNIPILIEVPQTTQTTPSLWAGLINITPLAVSFALGQGVAQAAEMAGAGLTSSSSGSNSATLFALVNGILNNESDPSKSPDYINNFEGDIAGSSNGQYVVGRDFMKSSIYQGLMMDFNPVINSVENLAKDVLNLFFEAISPVSHFLSVFKIISDFDNWFRLVPSDKSRPLVAMGYSGGFMPLVEAIETRHYNTDTLIGLGAATTAPLNITFEDMALILKFVVLRQYGDAAGVVAKYISGISDMSQLGIKRTVNVWGTNDILHWLDIAGKRDSIGGVKTYNIEIAGASHFDYMQRSGETDPVKADFNRRVSKFVTDLTLASNDDAKLIAFLQRTMVTPDADGVWRFNP